MPARPAAAARAAGPATGRQSAGRTGVVLRSQTATLQHMDAPQAPLARVPRPHRVMVNIDTETRDALRALAFTVGESQSQVAADALRLLVPMMKPVASAIGKLKEHPHAAMAELAAHAELVSQQTKQVLRDVKRTARQMAPKAPPSSNTGG